MSLQNHITELERKHDALEKEIEKAQAHPATDSVELSELKRKKLLLKEEITRIKEENKITS